MHYTDNLSTPRLTTRFLTQEDVPAWAEFFKDPEAVQYQLLDADKTPTQRAQNWIDFCMARYQNGRLGLQALISSETGEFIGQCGLLVQEVNGVSEIEVGYHLLRQHWGKGYASEAAQMFRNYGFQHGFADSIISIIHPLNENSKKVAGRNGMQLVDEQAEFRDGIYHLFRITRQEWEQI